MSSPGDVEWKLVAQFLFRDLVEWMGWEHGREGLMEGREPRTRKKTRVGKEKDRLLSPISMATSCSAPQTICILLSAVRSVADSGDILCIEPRFIAC